MFQLVWFGRINYQVAYQRQLELHQLVCQNPKNIYIIGCEHDPVITAGRRISNHQVELSAETHGSQSIQVGSDQINNQPEIATRRGVPVVQSSRGGLMTLHSPGQLVIYPILNLREHQLSVRSYVSLLLKCTEQFLNEIGVPSYLKLDQPGVFTNQGKIAFCGVQVREHVTLHGVSINISNDLNLFSLIESCGVQNQKLDRVGNYASRDRSFSNELALEGLHRHWSRIFRSHLTKT